MAGSHAPQRCLRRWTLLLALPLLLVAVAGCKDDGPKSDAGGDAFDRGPMLRQIAEKVILPALREGGSSADALAAATASYAAAASKGAAQSELDAARAAFNKTMDVWQRIELMQLGPAGDVGPVAGGQGLRDQIYSWPTASGCYVDQQIVAKSYEASDFIATKLVSGFGLDALEYLLFHDAVDNSCAASSAINRDKTWEQIPPAELPQRRAQYAKVVADHVAAQVRKLVDAWEPSKGNFVAQLVAPGKGSNPAYDSARTAVDAVFAAIYYLERSTKDKKLALPTGVDPSCTAGACPELVESPWSRRSAEAILTNIGAFRAMFIGGDKGSDGPGFDDFLRGVNAADLSKSIESAIDDAEKAVRDLGQPLAEIVSNDLPKAREAHAAVKRVMDLVKSQLVTVLNLRVPDEGAGDND